jgi:hypothetical protein
MREFMVSSGGITVVGATTLIAISAAAAPSVNLEFLRFWVSQSANATSAQQRIQLATKASVFPTLTSYTPVKLKPSDPNASVITGATTGAQGTVGINASAEGAGTQTTVADDAFNVLNGWLHVPTPAETRVIPAGFASSLELYFPVTPGTTTNWSFGEIYREI